MKIVAIAGGVGGAKLAHGLSMVMPADDFSIIVNTGDDFRHLGLSISPDIDTVMYTLAGLENTATGWGRDHDTFHALETIEKLQGPAWFLLGDSDIGLHLERTRRLMEGQSLSEVSLSLAKAMGIHNKVLPMTDQTVATVVKTLEFGDLPFQEYFVYRKCEPTVMGFRYEGIEKSLLSEYAVQELSACDAIVICPSNPWVSIRPILAVKDMREYLKQKLVVGVSPILHGKTVKGPAAKMYQELGINPSATAVLLDYRDFLNGFLVDYGDEPSSELADRWGIMIKETDILMRNNEDRKRLGLTTLQFIKELLERNKVA